MAVIQDFFVYFTALTEDRRATPTDDLSSVVANATIDGEPLTLMQTISYYVITATAGHDTTASAMAGGLQALIEHPDQLARLQADPSLIATTADEMIRWTTPVKHFMRTATEDYAIRDRTIAAGESVLLSYPSANRDEDVFADPFRVRHRTQPQQAPRVRVRCALLPGRDAGSNGVEGPLRRAGASPRIDRAGWSACVVRKRCSSVD